MKKKTFKPSLQLAKVVVSEYYITQVGHYAIVLDIPDWSITPVDDTTYRFKGTPDVRHQGTGRSLPTKSLTINFGFNGSNDIIIK